MTGPGSLKKPQDTALLSVAMVATMVVFLAGGVSPAGAVDEVAPAVPTSAVPALTVPSSAVSTPVEGPSGYPLPRFVSLGSDRVNMRIGPGIRYPVTWVYLRRGLPLEIVRESDDWRNVRDPEGAEGWMHKAMLSGGTRTAVVIGQTRQPLLRRPRADAKPVAEVEPGVVVTLKECPATGALCRVEMGRFDGWLTRRVLWGVYPNETIE